MYAGSSSHGKNLGASFPPLPHKSTTALHKYNSEQDEIEEGAEEGMGEMEGEDDKYASIIIFTVPFTNFAESMAEMLAMLQEFQSQSLCSRIVRLHLLIGESRT